MPSVGSTCRGVPVCGHLTPLLAAASRWVATTLGLTARHEGDMLGEEQWKWLDNQLQQTGEDPPTFTVIASSVQVLTSAPVFESWMHFPRSKARLLDLLKRHQPRGLILLSGDVHFAELLASPAAVSTGEMVTVSDSEKNTEVCGEMIEVTSSGLTHSCMTGGFMTWLTCIPVLRLFTSHRWPNSDSFSTEPNFGTIEFDWKAKSGPVLSASVRSAASGKELLSFRSLGCPLVVEADLDKRAKEESKGVEF